MVNRSWWPLDQLQYTENAPAPEIADDAMLIAKIRNPRVIALSVPGKEQAVLDIGADHVVSRQEPNLEKDQGGRRG